MSLLFLVGLYLVCWAAVLLREEIWGCEGCEGEPVVEKLAQAESK